MNSPEEIEERYIEARNDLKDLITYAHAISSTIKGKEASSESVYYASIIFSKIVSQAITLSRNSPTQLQVIDPSEAVVWDISTTCCIVRAILEAFDAMAYIAAHPNSEEIRLLRIKVWELHDLERRLKMLTFINRHESEEGRRLQKEADEVKSWVLTQENQSKLHKSSIGKIRKGETPDFLLPAKQRCELSDLNYEYYMGAKVFLSSYVHTYPLAIHQLSRFHIGDHDSLNLISIAIRYATVFVSKSIQDIRAVVNLDIPNPDPRVEGVMEIWNGIAAKGAQ